MLKPELRRYQAELFVIAIKTEKHYSKVFQVIFHSDGSLFVNFPYFLNNKGIASVVTLPANAQYPCKASFILGGKVTSRSLKYSHHRDGKTHFSQTGQVKTEIQKQSIPIEQIDGHIFTLTVQGLHGFKSVETRDMWNPSIKKAGLPIEIGGLEPAAIKLVGRWYSPQSFFNVAEGQSRGPVVTGQTASGHQVQGYIVGPPSGTPLESYTLFLSCERIPIINNNSDVDLTFVGGFDPPHIINNHEVDTTFLMLSYPVSSYEDMKMKIGSIDLR